MENLHAGDLVEASTEEVEMLSALSPNPPSACAFGSSGPPYIPSGPIGRAASMETLVD